jgi:hypothetical protein
VSRLSRRKCSTRELLASALAAEECLIAAVLFTPTSWTRVGRRGADDYLPPIIAVTASRSRPSPSTAATGEVRIRRLFSQDKPHVGTAPDHAERSGEIWEERPRLGACYFTYAWAASIVLIASSASSFSAFAIAGKCSSASIRVARSVSSNGVMFSARMKVQ